jgi:hypothetical protein
MDVGLPCPSKSSTLMIYSDFCACMILALKGLINIFPYHKHSYFLNFSVNCGLQDPKRGNWWLQVGSDVVGYWPKCNETGPIHLFMSSVIKQALLGLAGVWPLTESIN